MTFQEEQDKLLNTILNNLWFKYWKSENIEGKINERGEALELYITADCNQQCKYCYLWKYKDRLYPEGYRDYDLVTHNCRMLFEWLLENNYTKFKNIDIFTGEISGTKLSNDIFDIILEYIKKGITINQITYPTNGTFLLDPQKEQITAEYIQKFKDVKCRLCYSFSVDGMIVDKMCRPLRSPELEEKRDNAYYEKLFKWAEKYTFCFHPVLAAKAAKHWVENFDWWVDECAKRQLNFPERVGVLEVRNNDWATEDIKALLKVYDHVIDYMKTLDEYKNPDGTLNKEAWVRKIFFNKGISGSINITLQPAGPRIGCTNPRNLTVRLGDLAICPCHRTAYEELLYGNFEVKDNRIIGIKAKNVTMAMKMLTSDIRTSFIGCDTCDFKHSCYMPCLGACKEYKNDPFIIEESVCTMLKAKYYHLNKVYTEMGLFDTYKEMLAKDPTLSRKIYERTVASCDAILKHKEFEIYE